MGQRQPAVYASPPEQQPNPSLRKPAKPLPAEPKPGSKAKKGGDQVRLPAHLSCLRLCWGLLPAHPVLHVQGPVLSHVEAETGRLETCRS